VPSSQPSWVSTASARTNLRQLCVIGEDLHDMSAPLDLLVEALEHVGRLHVLVMGQREPVVAQRFLDVVLNPSTELGVFGLPLGQPGGDVAPDLGQVAPVIEPAELLQAVVIDLARNVVEGIPQEEDVAALPKGLRQGTVRNLVCGPGYPSGCEESIFEDDGKTGSLQHSILVGPSSIPVRRCA